MTDKDCEETDVTGKFLHNFRRKLHEKGIIKLRQLIDQLNTSETYALHRTITNRHESELSEEQIRSALMAYFDVYRVTKFWISEPDEVLSFSDLRLSLCAIYPNGYLSEETIRSWQKDPCCPRIRSYSPNHDCVIQGISKAEFLEWFSDYRYRELRDVIKTLSEVISLKKLIVAPPAESKRRELIFAYLTAFASKDKTLVATKSVEFYAANVGVEHMVDTRLPIAGCARLLRWPDGKRPVGPSTVSKWQKEPGFPAKDRDGKISKAEFLEWFNVSNYATKYIVKNP